MKVLIIGAGRMGMRHAAGVLQSKYVDSLTISDISMEALNNAKTNLPNEHAKDLQFVYSNKIVGTFDVIIIASTAKDRLSLISQILALEPKYLLIEKPLGQSYQDVTTLNNWVTKTNTKVYVNLNMRMYSFINDLKKDLHNLPQFEGLKQINFTGGTLGIGANGIHYLDLVYYLLDADDAKIIAASIDDTVIPSGRGSDFADFGGWACIHFYKQQQLVGKSILSLSSSSTVFGGWEIIGKHGRIRINELEGERVDILRNPQSTMPINRYAADYLPPTSTIISSPFLGDITKNWIDSIKEENVTLPSLDESIKVHRLMFDWLDFSNSYKKIFPIT